MSLTGAEGRPLAWIGALLAVTLAAAGAPHARNRPVPAESSRAPARAAQRGAPPPPSITVPDFQTLSRDFRKLGRTLLSRVPEADRPRVRLRLATDALTVAEARPSRERAWAVSLIEQACALLRDVRRESPEVQEFFRYGGVTVDDDRGDYFSVERLWHRAATSLLLGWLQGVAAETHIRHTLSRFPDDPHLVLARGVLLEWTHVPRARLGDPVDERNWTNGRVVIGRFEAAEELDEVSTEATIRLGYTLLRLNRSREALEKLDVAAGSVEDPYLVYLTHLFRGQALDHLDRFDQSVDAYRAAAAAVPGAQTAAIALAVALARTGAHDEAVRVAARATRNSSTSDPFITYGTGDFRSWPELIGRLREAVR